VRTVYPDKALRTRGEYSRVAFADSIHRKFKRNLKMEITPKKEEDDWLITYYEVILLLILLCKALLWLLQEM